MELTCQSTEIPARKKFNVPQAVNEPVIALAGNPNTGKSTLFNALTGLRQHTGNWPGKTVLQSKGYFIHKMKKYTLIDLPGTYSLLANSPEEEVARDFICFARPEATIVVTDATCLERNLNLALQVMEITSKVIVCINLIDEARRKNININTERLEHILGVPVIPTAARTKEGLPQLIDMVSKVVSGHIKPEPHLIKYEAGIEEAVSNLEPKIRAVLGENINTRWIALRLLDGDISLIKTIEQLYGEPGFKEIHREVLA